VLEAVFILLEFPSPSRRIFNGSHSLPPLWYAVSVLQTPRSPRTKPEKMKNFEDPVRKVRILQDKELHPIRRETDDKGPNAEGGRL
jgi:hypothetical protein